MSPLKSFACFLTTLIALNACGFRPPSNFDSSESCTTNDCGNGEEDSSPSLCKLYGKEGAFLNCLGGVDSRQQKSLKAILRSKDQTGDWSSDYFYSDDFSSRYRFSDTEVQCLESVLCDQSSNGN